MLVLRESLPKIEEELEGSEDGDEEEEDRTEEMTRLASKAVYSMKKSVNKKKVLAIKHYKRLPGTNIDNILH